MGAETGPRTSVRGLLALLLGGVALALCGGCVSDSGFQCASDDECTGGAGGACEASGFCSFADPSCDSGRRYGSSSGPLSDLCTDVTGDRPDASMQPDADPNAPDADPNAPDAGPDDPDAMPGTPDAAPGDPDAGDVLVDFAPSNLPEAYLTDATNALTLQVSDGEVVIDSDTGSITRVSDNADLHPIGVNFYTVTQSGPDLGVLTMTDLWVEDGVTIRVVGTRALAFAVGGDVTLHGVIDVSGGASSVSGAGPGGYAGGTLGSCGGGGPGGAADPSSGTDIGGGGGGHVASGGDGGDRGGTSGGSGGSSAGSPALVPLHGGSGGACGGGGTKARGGGGGGAVQISARGTVRIGATGAVTSGGGGGEGGPNDSGGGGGGAGGAVLIEAGRIVINGVVAANGGGGGAGANDVSPGDRGDDGLASATRASGGSPSGEGKAGGDGGAGATAAGEDGSNAIGNAGSDNAGGGGGSAGRIRLRSDDISRPGTISPTAGLTEVGL